MASRSSTTSSQPEPSGNTNPVTAALDRSVTWRAPPVRCHASQVSTVPKRSRSAGMLGRRPAGRAGGRASWPTGSGPGAARPPAAPGSRRRCAGPANRGPGPRLRPSAASHRIVEAPLVRDADGLDDRRSRPRRRTSAATSRAAPASASGVELDQARERRRRRQPAVIAPWCSVPSGSTRPARRPLVPTSMIRTDTGAERSGARRRGPPGRARRRRRWRQGRRAR